MKQIQTNLTNPGKIFLTWVLVLVLMLSGTPSAIASCAIETPMVGPIEEMGYWETVPMAAPEDLMQSVHTVLLPDGTILSASGSSFRTTLSLVDGEYVFDNGIDTSDYGVINNSSIFDPTTNTFTRIPSPPAVVGDEANDLFCAGHIQLADGDVLFMSGTGLYKPSNGVTSFTGSRQINVYHWQTGEWSTGQPMAEGRWYPSPVVLADGKVAIFSGLRYDPPNWLATTMEIYNPDTGNLQLIELKDLENSPFQTPLEDGTDGYDIIDIYPRIFSLADGRLLITGDEAGIENVTVSETGQKIPHSSRRTYLLSLKEDASGQFTVSFAPGPEKAEVSKAYSAGLQVPNSEDILLIGGMVGTNSINFGRGGNFDGFPPDAAVTASLQRWVAPTTVCEGDGHWEIVEDFLDQPRANLQAVILPTEQILVLNGGRYPEYQPVYEPILLTPDGDAPGGYTTQTMNPAKFPRLYHNGAILLPDARVLVMGGNGNRASRMEDGTVRVDVTFRDGKYSIPEFQDAAGNPKPFSLEAYYNNPQSFFVAGDPEPFYVAEVWQGEIFTPPYLLKPGVRSEIVAAPTRLTYGEAGEVSVEASNCEGSVSLMKLGSVTHSFDYGQRLVTLDATPIAAEENTCSFGVQAPTNPHLYPPGYYMMFYVNEFGKPSHARMVQLHL